MSIIFTGGFSVEGQGLGVSGSQCHLAPIQHSLNNSAGLKSVDQGMWGKHQQMLGLAQGRDYL